jgi:hypothetical protein
VLSVVNNDGTTETGFLMDAIVREGATFRNGYLVERPEGSAA